MKAPRVSPWVPQIWENPPDPLVSIFPSLAEVDMRKAETKLLLVSLVTLIFSFVFLVSYLGSFCFITFRSKLRTKEKIFWCLSFVRGLFGFVAIFFGLWYIVLDDTLQKDVVNGSTQTSLIATNISVGFFLFECLTLFSSIAIFGGFDAFLVVHHTLSLIGMSTVLYYDSTHFFAVCGLILEMTTPFSCFCWMLLKADMAHLTIWKANQLVLIHLFHSRSTIEGFFVYKMYVQWENINNHMPTPLLVMITAQLTLQLIILTPYWTYKKMGQLFSPVDWNHPKLQKQKDNIKDGAVSTSVKEIKSKNDSRKRK